MASSIAELTNRERIALVGHLEAAKAALWRGYKAMDLEGRGVVLQPLNEVDKALQSLIDKASAAIVR